MFVHKEMKRLTIALNIFCFHLGSTVIRQDFFNSVSFHLSLYICLPTVFRMVLIYWLHVTSGVYHVRAHLKTLKRDTEQVNSHNVDKKGKDKRLKGKGIRFIVSI